MLMKPLYSVLHSQGASPTHLALSIKLLCSKACMAKSACCVEPLHEPLSVLRMPAVNALQLWLDQTRQLGQSACLRPPFCETSKLFFF